VHQLVVRSFAATGRPPDAAGLDAAAADDCGTAREVLAELHAEDFLRRDDVG
jgi:hypothetical protein